MLFCSTLNAHCPSANEYGCNNLGAGRQGSKLTRTVVDIGLQQAWLLQNAWLCGGTCSWAVAASLRCHLTARPNSAVFRLRGFWSCQNGVQSGPHGASIRHISNPTLKYCPNVPLIGTSGGTLGRIEPTGRHCGVSLGRHDQPTSYNILFSVVKSLCRVALLSIC